MTNETTVTEILPPLSDNPPVPDSTAQAFFLPGEESPAAAEKDYAVPAAPTAKDQNRIPATKIIRVAATVLCSAVFAFAMYTELSATIASVTPDSVSDFIAGLAFGGSYAGAEQDKTPEENPMRPPKHDNDMIYFGSEESGEATTQNNETEPAPPETDIPHIPNIADGEERYPIVVRDLSTKADRGLSCSNQTDYELDLDYFADNEFVLPPLTELQASFPGGTNDPVVLIVHTHGTECYAEEGSDSYTKKTPTRTNDITKNVVAVGTVIANYLEAHGIPTIHCTEMFDRESYVEAYSNSSAAVREYLAIYPSIRYIFDVHRDSVISSDYTKTRPATEIDGVSTAQYMCVVGTDAAGSSHKAWRDNLTLAAHMQVRLWNRSNTLTRRLSIRSASFYQQYASGSLLLEIGSCGNTLSEAKACAQIVAEELAEIIIAGE